MILVPADTLSEELAALMVPLLFRVLCCLVGFRWGEIDPDCELTTPLLLEPRRRKS